MGLLLHVQTGRMVTLAPRSLVGRAPACKVRLEDRRASAEHAVIVWEGGSWQVRDLGSLNGTFIDGQRLGTGERVPLRRDARLGFGLAQDCWVLADDRAAGPAAMHQASARLVHAHAGLLAIPSPTEPHVTVFLGEDGRWRAEEHGATRPVHDREHVRLEGGEWTLFLPERFESLPGTLRTGDAPARIATLALRFRVSRDEEHVEVRARAERSGELLLPPRSCHYTLLTLARERLADAGRGLGEGEQGWIYASELARMLGYTPERVNVEIFRARALLAKLGVQDAAGLIERRASTRQLRIGVARLSVDRHESP
jgi:FHA domain